MNPQIVEGLNGWQALDGCCRDEYTFDLHVPNYKSYHQMTRKNVEAYITANDITVSDLNGHFWTRTWNEPKQTDKEKCVADLHTFVRKIANLTEKCPKNTVGDIVDKYWPGENKCG